MRLQRYLERLHTILTSRQELVLEYLHIDEIIPGQVGMIEGRLRFWDNSLLEFTEAIATHNMILAKTRYAYHYQNEKEHLIFRYDNAPHHPEVKTFPHHKHVMNLVNQIETIEPATAPHLNDVLREIDQLLYAASTY